MLGLNREQVFGYDKAYFEVEHNKLVERVNFVTLCAGCGVKKEGEPVGAYFASPDTAISVFKTELDKYLANYPADWAVHWRQEPTLIECRYYTKKFNDYYPMSLYYCIARLAVHPSTEAKK